ncbi:MAG: flagellar biosynthesis protein FlhF [Phycisphaerae bacterium]
MKLKTFQAKTMAEALAQVKKHMGRDAVILHTRTFTRGGLFGLGGCPMVEITAARNVADLPKYANRARLARKTGCQTASAEGVAAPMVPTSSRPQAGPAELTGLRTEMSAVRSMVRDLVRETRRSQVPSLPNELFDTYLELVQNEVSEDLAQKLVQSVRQRLGDKGLSDKAAVRRQLAEFLTSMVPVAGPIQLADRTGPTVIALIGPTGVGKTTSIAKLAANFRLREHKRVGLITVDTYRIAAVEQLRTYAQIINVPLEVVMSPAQMSSALRRLGDCDVVLIDTAGRSPNDPDHLKELQAYLEQAHADEVHLVLSSTASPQALERVWKGFGPLGIDRVMFTKLDEAIGFGVIAETLLKVGARLSYLTTGQDVPDDIEVGKSSRVAELVLGAGLSGPTPLNAGQPGGARTASGQ